MKCVKCDGTGKRSYMGGVVILPCIPCKGTGKLPDKPAQPTQPIPKKVHK